LRQEGIPITLQVLDLLFAVLQCIQLAPGRLAGLLECGKPGAQFVGAQEPSYGKVLRPRAPAIDVRDLVEPNVGGLAGVAAQRPASLFARGALVNA
jgi:hypothetical protein